MESLFQVSLDYGKPFLLFLEYKPALFRFDLTFNGEFVGSHPTRDDHPDLVFGEVTARGDLSITFMGFVKPGAFGH